MHARLLVAMVAFTCAVAVPVRAIAVPSGPAGEQASTSTATLATSSGGCVPPSTAVDLYTASSGESGAVEFGSDSPAACEKICDKFVDTCDDIANIAKSCLNRGSGYFAELQRETCGTFDTRNEKKACRDEINLVRGVVKDCTNEDRHHAAACCDNNRAYCLQQCAGSSNGGFAACFTGPGGYAGGTCFFGLANLSF